MSFELKFCVCRHVSIWGFQNSVCLSVRLSVCLSVRLSICPYPEKRNQPWLRQYQSYISKWYINGKVFTSTTPWKPKNLKKKNFKKVRNSNFDLWRRAEITLVSKSWNHLSFVNISPILVIDTSMERSSRVLQHRNPKIWI